jgi:putative lipoic acid-binding regulatory protein
MKKKIQNESFYQRFQKQLLDTSLWPATYVFKFIIPTDGNTQDSLMQLFENEQVTTNVRQSSKGKYTSVSIEGTFAHPDVIIEKYKAAAKIPNIIQL